MVRKRRIKYNETTKYTEKMCKLRAFLRDTITIIVIAAIIVAGQRTIAPKIVVDGPSMNTTLSSGEQIVVNRLVYKFHPPQRGDIIVFFPPGVRDEYIKRIIGLPGESVEITEGVVYIHQKNGKIFPLDEPYIRDPSIRDYAGETIPYGEYFVLGDNRNNSSDSRAGWTVPFESIIGKAWLSVWPPNKWGVVDNFQMDQTARANGN